MDAIQDPANYHFGPELLWLCPLNASGDDIPPLHGASQQRTLAGHSAPNCA